MQHDWRNRGRHKLSAKNALRASTLVIVFFLEHLRAGRSGNPDFEIIKLGKDLPCFEQKQTLSFRRQVSRREVDGSFDSLHLYVYGDPNVANNRPITRTT